jgi:hypothetical protein
MADVSDESFNHEAFNPADSEAGRELVQQLRQAEADYAAGNTVSGEEFGLS